MNKIWNDKAWEAFRNWTEQDRKTVRKIFQLISDIDRTPYIGYGKPEPLCGNLSGFWSRRIDLKNRLVYKIEENAVYIIECGTHYGDK